MHPLQAARSTGGCTQQVAGGRLRAATLRARQVVLALREVHVVHLHRQLKVVDLHRVICTSRQGYQLALQYT